MRAQEIARLLESALEKIDAEDDAEGVSVEIDQAREEIRQALAAVKGET